jgi:ubiquinone/menaquinone biosynthesis C-methylase UbiE
VAIQPLIADVEQLPFADRSFDVSFVHDGLHHLERPLVGLAELARVARVGVSVTEPARAAITRLAVRAGVAVDREESGNIVARLELEHVTSELARHGFRLLKAKRYAMYYGHVPGRASRALSAGAAYGATRGVFLGANRLLGRFGNKLTVQAVR